MLRRNLFAGMGAALVGLIAARGTPAEAATVKKPARMGHRVAFHIDQNQPEVMNLLLNNATNVVSYYAAKKQKVMVEIVAYGPGLHILREDTSPVKARIAAIRAKSPNVIFSACANTMAGMKKMENKDIPLVPEAGIVPSGVVRLVELQEQHWSYIRT